jgi:hypothetical protein
MMNHTNFAYPFVRHIDSTVIAEGLTKRELMAAMMLQGILSNSDQNLGIHSAAQNAVLATDALIYQLAELEPQA